MCRTVLVNGPDNELPSTGAVFHCPAQLITIASICNQCVAGACLNVLYSAVSQRQGWARRVGQVKVRMDQ